MSMYHTSGVEALVGWLLDHPDIHITELSDADTVSDEYSDEEVLEELEEAEPSFPVVNYSLFYFCLHLPLSLPNSPHDIALYVCGDISLQVQW